VIVGQTNIRLLQMGKVRRTEGNWGENGERQFLCEWQGEGNGGKRATLVEREQLGKSDEKNRSRERNAGWSCHLNPEGERGKATGQEVRKLSLSGGRGKSEKDEKAGGEVKGISNEATRGGSPPKERGTGRKKSWKKTGGGVKSSQRMGLKRQGFRRDRNIGQLQL